MTVHIVHNHDWNSLFRQLTRENERNTSKVTIEHKTSFHDDLLGARCKIVSISKMSERVSSMFRQDIIAWYMGGENKDRILELTLRKRILNVLAITVFLFWLPVFVWVTAALRLKHRQNSHSIEKSEWIKKFCLFTRLFPLSMWRR